jgi:hypothetical protein
MSLAELELSVRATNCLESEGITTVRHLVSRSEDQLLTVRNFGETTLKEVKAKLHEIGLDLGMDVPSRQGRLDLGPVARAPGQTMRPPAAMASQPATGDGHLTRRFRRDPTHAT